MYRASVTANNVDLGEGAAAEVLIDGAETPTTANGLAGYIPVPGDRLLVEKVGNQLEVVQFVSVGTVPQTAGIEAIIREVVGPDYNFTGSQSLGELTVTEADGFDIPGVVHFPLDGTGDASLTVHLTAKSATFEDNANFRGLTTLEGEFLLQHGIGAPAVDPVVSSPTVKVATELADDPIVPTTTVQGMAKRINGTGNQVAITRQFFGSQFRVINADTGVLDPFIAVDVTGNTALAESARFKHDARIASLASTGHYYVLARRDSDFKWGIDVYDEDFVWQSQLKGGITYPNDPAIGTDDDNDEVLVSWVNASDQLKSRRYDTSGTQLGVDKTHHTFGGAKDMRWVAKGEFDHAGTVRWYFVTTDGTVRATDDGTAPARQTTYEFAAPSTGARGFAWDGTRLLAIEDDGRVRHYSTGRPADQSINVVYTWYDGDATGGTHETTPSPNVAATINARNYVKVAIPAPPQYGQAGTDVAEAARVFIGIGAGTKFVQATLTAPDGNGSWGTAALGTLATSGDAPPGSNGFDAISITPGVIHSGKEDANGPLVEIAGDGEWRLTGLAGRTTDDMILGPDGAPLFAVEEYRSTSTATLTTGTFTAVLGFTVNRDQGYMTGPTSGVVTFSAKGFYDIKAMIHFANSSAGRRVVRFLKNGTETWREDRASGGAHSLTTSYSDYFAVGDTLEIQAFQNSGGNLDLGGGTGQGHKWLFTRIGVEET